MALEFIHRRQTHPQRIVLFPGAWNPPTVAHLEIALAARETADEVVWVLPKVFPHKAFESVGLEDRSRLLEAIVKDRIGFSAAVSERGLYADIAREARETCGAAVDIALVLGRDAAERIAAWDYGRAEAFDEFIAEYKLLVAARNGDYQPAHRHRERIKSLPMGTCWDEVSSSEVRRRIRAGEKWRHLVPAEIRDAVQRLY